ncbi:unnamed protein product [Camellia sinensis]
MAGGGTSGQSLEYTPTWAFATVCFFIIAISIIIEHSIHLITKWLKRNRKSALYDAVEKLKSELMLLGFMSLILAVTQESISNICIPTRLADIMLPCRKETEAETTTTVEHFTVGVIRNLNFSVAGLYNGSLWTIPRRGLDEDDVDAGAVNSTDKCTAEIEAFKHRVVVDPKYAEKTWKILEHAIQEIYNHKIGCVYPDRKMSQHFASLKPGDVVEVKGCFGPILHVERSYHVDEPSVVLQQLQLESIDLVTEPPSQPYYVNLCISNVSLPHNGFCALQTPDFHSDFVLKHPLVASAVFGSAKLWQLQQVLDAFKMEIDQLIEDGPKLDSLTISSITVVNCQSKQEFNGNYSVQVYTVQACIPKYPAALWNAEFVQAEELLRQPSTIDNCLSLWLRSGKGKVSLVSQEGIHQLHIFFFVLAVMQIVYSVLTMALGRLKALESLGERNSNN